VDAGKIEGKIFLAAPLDESDLQNVQETVSVKWDSERGMIAAALEKRIGMLVLFSRPVQKMEESQRVKILCDAVRAEGLKLLNWGEVQEEWQTRVLSLKHWRQEEGWPDVSDEYLLSTADQWLAPFLSNVSKRIDFQRLDMMQILSTVLPWELQSKLDKLAPTRLTVPSGSFIKIIYSKTGSAPVMEVRLQEVFGWTETPTINEGRTKILLHLLSPGYKPVQVTQDLKSFWQTTYHEVRKELRMRYPKHHWPEDPWTAEAVRGVKRR
jgi:ATP-dependent helicase HrpB